MLAIYIVLLTAHLAMANVCPELCTCDGYLTTIDCTGVGLDEIPSNLPHSAHELKLARNKITTLGPKVFFGCPNLWKLHLSHNAIDNISHEAFTTAIELVDLDLSYNRISKLHPSTFMLSSLETLNLAGNALDDLTPGIFSGCYKLAGLHLAHNKFTTKTLDRVNQEVPWLTNLDLSNNVMGGVPYLALNNMALLQFLLLKESGIERIDSNAFVGLGKLEYLDLSGNSIQQLTREMFQPLLSVAAIDLSGNDVICECSVKEIQDWLKENKVLMISPAACKVIGSDEMIDISSGDLQFLCTYSVTSSTTTTTTTITQTAPPDPGLQAAGADPVVIGLSVVLIVVVIAAIIVVTYLIYKMRKKPPHPQYASIRKHTQQQQFNFENQRVPRFMQSRGPYEDVDSNFDLNRPHHSLPSPSSILPPNSASKFRMFFRPPEPLPSIPDSGKVRRFTKPADDMRTLSRPQQRPLLSAESPNAETQSHLNTTSSPVDRNGFSGMGPPLDHSQGGATLERQLTSNSTMDQINPYEEIRDSD